MTEGADCSFTLACVQLQCFLGDSYHILTLSALFPLWEKKKQDEDALQCVCSRTGSISSNGPVCRLQLICLFMLASNDSHL